MTEVIKQMAKAAGMTINGKQPDDIQIHHKDFQKRLLAEGSLGFGEMYMEGWWDAEKVDEVITKLLTAKIDKQVRNWKIVKEVVKAKIINSQSKHRSKKVAQEHYDLDNELYEKMLDKNMQYTCAYWKNAKNLEEAQLNKLRLVAEKLKLKKGMKVLELGSGFGGLARFVAKEYGCEVTCYNISKEQIKYGKEICKGLPVTFIEADYREATGTFDRVMSIGLCEHVGPKNYQGLMQLAHDQLKDKGLFILHTIGGLKSNNIIDPWVNKYIFPGAVLPSAKQLTTAAEGLLNLEDFHNFGPDYDKTLMAWYENFVNNWDSLKEKYDERFFRMWSYYLLACAATFRVRNNQLFQLVFSKGRREGTYEAVR